MRRSWALGLMLVACGDGNELGGSISDSYSLEFDEVEITKQGDDLVVEYLRNVSDPPDKVCKLVVEDTRLLDLSDNSNIKGDVFLRYVTLSRVTGSGGDFPSVKSGEVHIETWEFEDGGEVDGEFSAIFDNGLTIDGEFDGEVKAVSLD